MYIDDHSTSCCAINEIVDLRTAKNPEAVVREIAENSVMEDISSWGNSYRIEFKPPAFILFTEVIRVPKKSSIPTGYGAKLAAYIKKYKLGHLAISHAKRNRINHPDHFVRCYIWSTNKTALHKLAKAKGWL